VPAIERARERVEPPGAQPGGERIVVRVAGVRFGAPGGDDPKGDG
jgi:hypothetical protein